MSGADSWKAYRSGSDNRYPPDWDSRRRQVYRRDNHTCQRCGANGGPYGDTELHAHHQVPVSKGGSHAMSNLETVCKSCHERIHGHPIPTGGSSSSSQSTSSSSSSVTRTDVVVPTEIWDRFETLNALGKKISIYGYGTTMIVGYLIGGGESWGFLGLAVLLIGGATWGYSHLHIMGEGRKVTYRRSSDDDPRNNEDVKIVD